LKTVTIEKKPSKEQTPHDKGAKGLLLLERGNKRETTPQLKKEKKKPVRTRLENRKGNHLLFASTRTRLRLALYVRELGKENPKGGIFGT